MPFLNDNSVKCWGYNGQGQLGLTYHGTGTDRDIPQAVSLGTGKTATAIGLGEYYTCAILNDNSVKCWGSNANGRLGLGDSQTDSLYNSPQAVNLGSHTAKFITLGKAHTCAILNDSSLRCWGSNGNGRLGIGSTGGSYNTPQAVSL